VAKARALRHAEANKIVGELMEKVKKLPKGKKPDKKV
jgi:hypothetical protein